MDEITFIKINGVEQSVKFIASLVCTWKILRIFTQVREILLN